MRYLNYNPDREDIARSGPRFFGSAAQFKLLPGSNLIEQDFVDFLESVKEEEPYKTWWRNTVLQYSKEEVKSLELKVDPDITYLTEEDPKPTRKPKVQP